MSLKLFALALVVSSLGSATSKPTQVVQTTGGPVQGVILATVWHSVNYSAFKGIPYGAPPIKEMRFKPPQPAKPWKEILNASREGNVCMQIDSATKTIIGSEDCLYLNVYSPETSFSDAMELKPVMVWIHGGNFDSGSGNSDLYGPDFFIETDVVMVTINYRLGGLGFLSAQRKEIMGNAGLKDQNLALKWVQSNIAKFGGDPRQVTIFGESAGAASIDYHVLSEKSAGLFHRSISMSGSPLCPWGYSPPKQAVERAFRLGSLLGHNTRSTDDLVNFFMNASASDIVAATEKLVPAMPPLMPTMENTKVGPIKDIFLAECPYRKYQRGSFNKHDHMMGLMKEEAVSFAEPLDNLLNMVNVTLEAVNMVTQNTILKSHILDEWFSILGSVSENLTEATIRKIVKIISSIMFDSPIDQTQKMKYRHSPKPIYYYKMSYETPYAVHKVFYNISLDGAAHADDLGYMFHMPKLGAPTDPNHPFNVFRSKVVRLWSNFAKYGNPTPQGEKDQLLKVNWQNSGLIGWQLNIDENLTLGKRDLDAATLFYQGIAAAASYVTQGCTNIISKIIGII